MQIIYLFNPPKSVECWILYALKGLVHFQMKITPSFTHPQAILCVYDFLLSDEHNLRYINKYPDASELYNGNEQGSRL